jgi:hypothetical protein
MFPCGRAPLLGFREEQESDLLAHRLVLFRDLGDAGVRLS